MGKIFNSNEVNDMSKSFGEILREKRKERGWTLRELSERSNVSIWTISTYERKGQFPSVFIAMDLANAFGCSVYELCGVKEKGDRK
jgi:transcriptional regulator with XRE-family HTH domain